MLSVWITTAPTSGAQWWDVSYSLENISISTHERGYLECVLTLDTDPSITRAMVSGGGTPFVQVTDNAAPVWEGRIERVGRADGKAVLFARGLYAGVGDHPHSALYAMSSPSAFKPMENGLDTNFNPSRWDLRVESGGLSIIPRKGESFGASANEGGLYYVGPPYMYSNFIEGITFTYSYTAPAGWYLRIYTFDYNANAPASFVGNPWSLNGNGANQTGTATVTFAARTMIVFSIDNTNAPAALAVETGTYFANITDVLVFGDSSTPTTRDVVAGAVVQAASSQPGFLSSSSIMISASESITTAVYSGVPVQDIFADCAALGDGSNNPVEYGVYDDGVLFFQTRGTIARTWYTDESGFEVERGMEDVYNRAVALYTDWFGNECGSGIADNSLSMSQLGIVRGYLFRSAQTELTSANDEAVSMVNKTSGAVPSIRGNLTTVIDGSGVVHPLHAVRANDLLVIRSLDYGDAAETTNGFRISKTKYTAGVGREALTIELESPNAVGTAFTSAGGARVPTVVRPPSPQPPGVGRPPVGQG